MDMKHFKNYPEIYDISPLALYDFDFLWPNACIHSTINSFSIPSFSSHSLTADWTFFMNEISFMCMRPHFFCYFYSHFKWWWREKWHEELIIMRRRRRRRSGDSQVKWDLLCPLKSYELICEWESEWMGREKRARKGSHKETKQK